MTQNVLVVTVVFLLWAGLWVWILRKRSSRLTLRKLLVIVTGFAVIAWLATPAGQLWLTERAELHPIWLLCGIVAAAALVLWIEDWL